MATTEASTETEQAGPLLTSYRVTWTPKGKDEPRTAQCIVNTDDMTRPSDPAQRDELLRRMIGIRHLPHGQTSPDNVVLLMVDPICNCEPYPGEKCTWAVYKGERFALQSTSNSRYESIYDRGTGDIVGTVSISLSVEFLTMVRMRYEHN
ncbi:hypothetical protein [Streptomyces sp. NPDC017260]|uniref:hypothetical protein n=1 Tax=unclassified Streptomyces TaxID=2593676 RepID=UPI0037B18683